ncbi:MAG TPA: phage terminase large subunit [Candidatus Wunengus sp. YC60]|uniref:phage terminase large subunit n=1 Tax=Candidatus Wunengus sp. YC60 TaxID=3367697 RepID=UPI0040296591
MKKIIENISSEIGRFRRRVGMDFISFRNFYFPNYNKNPDGEFQKELSQILIDMKTKRGARYAIAAPRGFAKSTIVGLQYAIYCICYKLEDFIVIASSTSSQATDFLRHIKEEFETNERLKADFPEVCEVGGKLLPPRWTQSEIITSNDVKVVALGTGQQLRGRRHKESRPTLIILDDIETDESVENPDSRYKLEDWINKTVLKAGDARTNVIIIGTLHHPASLLAKYTDPKQCPGWNSKVYKAVISYAEAVELWEQWKRVLLGKENYNEEFGLDAARAFYKKHESAMLKGVKLLWPDFKSYHDLMLMREQEGYSSFDSEMQNQPINPRDCAFNMDEVSFWEDEFESEEYLMRLIRREALYYGACDPSLGREGKQSDDSGIVVVAWNAERGKIYVLEADIARRSPDRTIEDILAHHMKYEIVQFGFETNQFQEVMAKDLMNRARERHIAVRLKEIKNTVDKLARIQSLQALIKSGTIMFSRKHQTLLEQLRYFPKGPHDDGLDALEMVVRLCYKPARECRCLSIPW